MTHNTREQERLKRAVIAHFDVDKEEVTQEMLDETFDWVYNNLVENHGMKEINPMGLVFVKTQIEEFFNI